MSDNPAPRTWLHGLPEILSIGEVARIFDRTPKTIVAWADAGKLPCFRTQTVDPDHPGHRRFRRADVLALLAGEDDRALAVMIREIVDAGYDVTVRRGGGEYEVEFGRTVAGTRWVYGGVPEAALVAAWEEIRRPGG